MFHSSFCICELYIWTVKIYSRYNCRRMNFIPSLPCCALWGYVLIMEGDPVQDFFLPPVSTTVRVSSFARLFPPSLFPYWSPPSPSPSSIAICQAKSRTSSRICNSRSVMIPRKKELALCCRNPFKARKCPLFQSLAPFSWPYALLQ